MAQVDVLKKYIFTQEFIAKERTHHIDINTIDSFQGQERDIIYISLVRSNPKGSIGFLSDIRRINVAITRARKKLVIIGDTATIGQHPFYSKLIDYVNEIGAYRHAYEFLNR
jgi:superfamily I DNA and/or RNA helicase